ncbi:binary toxin-like calcium binding domain-containing protein [Bacillus cereus group sp. BfR-BA-01524]|uniref:binary toxin-like calcium binding domain-containing protein n=1 Tax=Bacillus cereus group sp. BfR-BA-01524 TaxID=2920372 RepID=UPI001F5AF9C3
MNIKSVYKCIATTVLLSQIMSPNILHAQEVSDKAQSGVVNQAEIKRSGLMGYYYNDSNFNELVMMTPEKNGDLKIIKEDHDELLSKEKQSIQSIRWIGYIKPSESGEYTFSTSSDQNIAMQIDGKTVINQSPMENKIELEKDKLYEIRLEYRQDEAVNQKNLSDLQLFWARTNSDKIVVPEENLVLPNFAPGENKTKLIPETPLLDDNSIPDTTDQSLDTDDDGILDHWEINGYTIKGQKSVLWTKELGKKGYIKYVSNPMNAYTTGDPYTDFEKASGHLPAAVAKEAHNPLVAAFPAVGVKMEKMIISENKDYTNSEEHAMSSSETAGMTFGGEVNVGYSGLYGITGGVTANFSHSNTTENTSSTSNGNTLHFNAADAAYVNLNVRYYNSGTAPIYRAAPTTSFVLGGETIGSFTAQANQIGNDLNPGDTYPNKELHALSLNTMDQFNSQPIKMNRQQLEKLRAGAPVKLETPQVAGKYAKIVSSGDISVAGDWAPKLGQIENKTADIILNTGDTVKEEKVAAKNYTDPEDKTPQLTLADALKIAFGAKEENGKLTFNGHNISEHSVELFYDENTKKEMMKQLEKMSNKNMYDIKLTPRMKIVIKTPTVLDNGKDSNIEWETTNINQPGLDDVGYSTGNIGYGMLKSKLEPNTSYVLSAYFKGTQHEKEIEFGIGSGKGEYAVNQKFELSQGGKWKKAELKFTTGDDVSKFNTVRVKNDKNDDTRQVYFDNIAITKLSKAEKKFDGVSEDYIKEAHAFESVRKDKNSGTDYVDSINLKVNRPIKWKYKVKVNGKEIGHSKNIDEPDSNGVIKINFLDFNSGIGIIATDHIEVYAVKEGLSPVKVAENHKYNMEAIIKFKNAGESGMIEPYGDIRFINNGEVFEIWKDATENSSREYTQDQPYKKDITFRTFTPITEESNIRFIANVKEEDYLANQDDILAYGENEPKDSKGLNGDIYFKGDVADDSVNIEYKITK